MHVHTTTVEFLISSQLTSLQKTKSVEGDGNQFTCPLFLGHPFSRFLDHSGVGTDRETSPLFTVLMGENTEIFDNNTRLSFFRFFILNKKNMF